ncbi:replication factor-A protein 1-related [Striga asiatica]|uniref:Replication factor-A protein 1-related n=1 Tax=Striga asiatica TaxID=4170 RepID=A0A5A7R6W0_STRAF|nr:replication factor-A protein 1-related [Striga asiatica]
MPRQLLLHIFNNAIDAMSYVPFIKYIFKMRVLDFSALGFKSRTKKTIIYEAKMTRFSSNSTKQLSNAIVIKKHDSSLDRGDDFSSFAYLLWIIWHERNRIKHGLQGKTVEQAWTIGIAWQEEANKVRSGRLSLECGLVGYR